MNSLEVQSHIANQKGKQSYNFAKQNFPQVNSNYNAFAQNMPPSGAQIMQELENLAGTSVHSVEELGADILQDLVPPKNAWEKSGLGAEMELFAIDTTKLKFESQVDWMGASTSPQPEFEKISDPFHGSAGTGLFHCKSTGKLPESKKNEWHFSFKITHKKTKWDIHKTVPDFLEFLGDMKTKYRGHIDKVVHSAEIRIKRIGELLSDVEKQQHKKFPDWNKTIETAQILDRTLCKY